MGANPYAAVGRTVHNPATGQEEGGYGAIATLLSNPKMFPGVDVSSLKQELEYRIEDRDGRGQFKTDPLALIKIGSNVWFQYLGEIVIGEFTLPSQDQSQFNLNKTTEKPEDIATWESVKYPSELQYLPAYTPGLYAVFVDNAVVYIGESDNLWARLNGRYQHHVKQHLDHAFAEGYSVRVADKIMAEQSLNERRELESKLQRLYQTPGNGTNNKSISEQQHKLTPVQQAIIDFVDNNGGTAKARDVYRAS